MTRMVKIFLPVLLAMTGSANTLAADSDGLSIPLTINWPDETLRYDFPVRNGIPLPQGAVLDVKQLSLLDSDGKPVPNFQSIPLGYWPDGSIKWALADFQACGENSGEFRLVADKESSKNDLNPLQVHETEEQIEVITGPLRFTILKLGGGGLNEPIQESFRQKK